MFEEKENLSYYESCSKMNGIQESLEELQIIRQRREEEKRIRLIKKQQTLQLLEELREKAFRKARKISAKQIATRFFLQKRGWRFMKRLYEITKMDVKARSAIIHMDQNKLRDALAIFRSRCGFLSRLSVKVYKTLILRLWMKFNVQFYEMVRRRLYFMDRYIRSDKYRKRKLFNMFSEELYLKYKMQRENYFRASLYWEKMAKLRFLRLLRRASLFKLKGINSSVKKRNSFKRHFSADLILLYRGFNRFRRVLKWKQHRKGASVIYLGKLMSLGLSKLSVYCKDVVYQKKNVEFGNSLIRKKKMKLGWKMLKRLINNKITFQKYTKIKNVTNKKIVSKSVLNLDDVSERKMRKVFNFWNINSKIRTNCKKLLIFQNIKKLAISYYTWKNFIRKKIEKNIANHKKVNWFLIVKGWVLFRDRLKNVEKIIGKTRTARVRGRNVASFKYLHLGLEKLLEYSRKKKEKRVKLKLKLTTRENMLRKLFFEKSRGNVTLMRKNEFGKYYGRENILKRYWNQWQVKTQLKVTSTGLKAKLFHKKLMKRNGIEIWVSFIESAMKSRREMIKKGGLMSYFILKRGLKEWQASVIKFKENRIFLKRAYNFYRLKVFRKYCKIWFGFIELKYENMRNLKTIPLGYAGRKRIFYSWKNIVIKKIEENIYLNKIWDFYKKQLLRKGFRHFYLICNSMERQEKKLKNYEKHILPRLLRKRFFSILKEKVAERKEGRSDIRLGFYSHRLQILSLKWWLQTTKRIKQMKNRQHLGGKHKILIQTLRVFSTWQYHHNCVQQQNLDLNSSKRYRFLRNLSNAYEKWRYKHEWSRFRKLAFNKQKYYVLGRNWDKYSFFIKNLRKIKKKLKFIVLISDQQRNRKKIQKSWVLIRNYISIQKDYHRMCQIAKTKWKNDLILRVFSRLLSHEKNWLGLFRQSKKHEKIVKLRTTLRRWKRKTKKVIQKLQLLTKWHKKMLLKNFMVNRLLKRINTMVQLKELKNKSILYCLQKNGKIGLLRWVNWVKIQRIQQKTPFLINSVQFSYPNNYNQLGLSQKRKLLIFRSFRKIHFMNFMSVLRRRILHNRAKLVAKNYHFLHMNMVLSRQGLIQWLTWLKFKREMRKFESKFEMKRLKQTMYRVLPKLRFLVKLNRKRLRSEKKVFERKLRQGWEVWANFAKVGLRRDLAKMRKIIQTCAVKNINPKMTLMQQLPNYEKLKKIVKPSEQSKRLKTYEAYFSKRVSKILFFVWHLTTKRNLKSHLIYKKMWKNKKIKFLKRWVKNSKEKRVNRKKIKEIIEVREWFLTKKALKKILKHLKLQKYTLKIHNMISLKYFEIWQKSVKLSLVSKRVITIMLKGDRFHLLKKGFFEWKYDTTLERNIEEICAVKDESKLKLCLKSWESFAENSKNFGRKWEIGNNIGIEKKFRRVFSAFREDLRLSEWVEMKNREVDQFYLKNVKRSILYCLLFYHKNRIAKKLYKKKMSFQFIRKLRENKIIRKKWKHVNKEGKLFYLHRKFWLFIRKIREQRKRNKLQNLEITKKHFEERKIKIESLKDFNNQHRISIYFKGWTDFTRKRLKLRDRLIWIEDEYYSTQIQIHFLRKWVLLLRRSRKDRRTAESIGFLVDQQNKRKVFGILDSRVAGKWARGENKRILKIRWELYQKRSFFRFLRCLNGRKTDNSENSPNIEIL